MQKDRDPSFDAFRAIAIIAVVAVHTSGTGFSWRCSATDRWNFFFLVGYLQVFLFAVPAFVFMSGYWSSKRPVKSLQDYRNFLVRKLPRVLVPYLFWSLILLGCAAVKTQDVNVSRMMLKLLTGGACYPYYFIIVIIQLYIITPLLQYINRSPYGLMLVTLLAVVGISALYLSRVSGVILHLPAYLPFYSWVIFYEIGLLAGSRVNKTMVSRNSIFFILTAVLLCLLASEVEGLVLLLKYDNLGWVVSPLKYSSLLYSVCMIGVFLFFREHTTYRPKLLVKIGQYSFGIYLIHILVLDKVAAVAQRISTIYSFQPLYQFIVVSITLSACYALISITRRLLPASFCRKILGF